MITESTRITLTAVRDLAAVEPQWRALQGRTTASFFQSWTWVSCLAAERFSDPVLLSAERGGQTVGLALLNRRSGRGSAERLWLNESGDPALDKIYVEHNGVLLACDAIDLLPACLRAILSAPIDLAGGGGKSPRRGRYLRMAAVDSAHLTAMHQVAAVRVERKSAAPFVDLAALPAGSEAYLNSLSANTRYQLRRSNRAFARLGFLVVRQAETVAEQLSFLDALAALHQASWMARGMPGAFANPAFVRFHRALIARATPGELVLLQIAAGPLVLGYLYNFRMHDTVVAYQSGFDYVNAAALAGPHAKPGLTSHYLAILRARAEGAVAYDLLAGPDRYKRSLARAETRLYWIDGAMKRSVQGLALRLRSVMQGS